MELSGAFSVLLAESLVSEDACFFNSASSARKASSSCACSLLDELCNLSNSSMRDSSVCILSLSSELCAELEFDVSVGEFELLCLSEGKMLLFAFAVQAVRREIIISKKDSVVITVFRFIAVIIIPPDFFDSPHKGRIKSISYRGSIKQENPVEEKIKNIFDFFQKRY